MIGSAIPDPHTPIRTPATLNSIQAEFQALTRDFHVVAGRMAYCMVQLPEHIAAIKKMEKAPSDEAMNSDFFQDLIEAIDSSRVPDFVTMMPASHPPLPISPFHMFAPSSRTPARRGEIARDNLVRAEALVEMMEAILRSDKPKYMKLDRQLLHVELEYMTERIRTLQVIEDSGPSQLLNVQLDYVTEGIRAIDMMDDSVQSQRLSAQVGYLIEGMHYIEIIDDSIP